MKRKLIYSPEYIAFYEQTTLRVQEKLQYATSMLEIINVVPTKFIKKLLQKTVDIHPPKTGISVHFLDSLF